MKTMNEMRIEDLKGIIKNANKRIQMWNKLIKIETEEYHINKLEGHIRNESDYILGMEQELNELIR